MLAKELREKTVEELEKMGDETREKLQKTKIDFIQEKETNVQKIRQLKKDYARILTVLNEKRSTEDV